MRRTTKKILIAIAIVLLIIIGVSTYYIMTRPTTPQEEVQETRKSKYTVNKKVNKNNIVFEIVGTKTNVVEHTIIEKDLENPEIYDMIIEENETGDYYIVTINTVAEKYYSVYNNKFIKISDDLIDSEGNRISYDQYEILEDGNIKLTQLEQEPYEILDPMDYEYNSSGMMIQNEYVYTQEGEIVSQDSNILDYIVPVGKVFAFDDKKLYIYGIHGEFIKSIDLVKTSEETYASIKCRVPNDFEYEIVGSNENTEWIHYGNKGANAKKYVFHYDTNEITIEDSKCVVE